MRDAGQRRWTALRRGTISGVLEEEQLSEISVRSLAQFLGQYAQRFPQLALPTTGNPSAIQESRFRSFSALSNNFAGSGVVGPLEVKEFSVTKGPSSAA